MIIDILYKDNDLVVINKPSGLLVHRSPIDKHETQFAVQILRDQIGQRVFPLHRLDKPTSGILVFGLKSEVTKQLQENWFQTQKLYLAMTRGELTSQELNHPIRTIKESGEIKTQEAETNFKLLRTVTLPVTFGRQAEQYTHTKFSLVEASPKTGRQHQIRKHLKHLSHPIIGDTCYGKGDINRYFREKYSLNRLMLHCQKMQFSHPITGESILIEASLDDHWQTVLTLFDL